jgi:hypothetical protein
MAGDRITAGVLPGDLPDPDGRADAGPDDAPGPDGPGPGGGPVPGPDPSPAPPAPNDPGAARPRPPELVLPLATLLGLARLS